MSALLEAMDRMMALDPDLRFTTCSAGAVVYTWRAAVEPWHRLFRDAESAMMNITATLDVYEVGITEEGLIDLDEVADVLCDGERWVRPEVTAYELFGDAWDQIADQIADHIEFIRTGDQVLDLLQCFIYGEGPMCTGWWGTPGYEAMVDEFVAKVKVPAFDGPPDALADTLKHRPLTLPLEVWKQVAGGNGYGWLETHGEREPTS